MKFLEFYFNPNGRKHTKYGSFCYKPANPTEKKLGYLGIAGELANVLPPNEKFLQEIAETAKNAYYSADTQNAQQAFEKTLEAVNALLESLRKSGNVSWLGNLHLVIFAVAGNELYLTKTGTIKFFLAKNGALLDAGKNLEASQTTHPLRIFSHFVTGGIAAQDSILILTHELFRFFGVSNILPKLARLETGKEEKNIKQLLGPHSKELKKYSGLLLTAVLERIEPIAAPSHNIRFASPLPKLRWNLGKPAFKQMASAIPKLLIIPLRFRIPFSLKISPSPIFESGRKKIFLIAAFIVVLLVGFSIAQFQKRMAVHTAGEKLLEIQQKIWGAENKLLAGNQKEGNILFQEALRELESLDNTQAKSRGEKLEKELRDRLTEVNKIETVVAEPIFSASKESQNILRIGDMFYLTNTGSKEIESWNSAMNETRLIHIPWSFDIAKEFQKFLLFYEKESNRLVVPDGVEIKLFPPHPEFSPVDVASFRQAVYFLDTGGSIVKYTLLPNIKELTPEVWIRSPEDTKLRNGISLAVDGSIWILSRGGTIHRYWGGSWRETLDLILWPKLTAPAKIFTANHLPYLYILDPSGKRLVILDKKGNPVKQYTNPAFDKLKDFTVSDDGKTIYLLNGREVYEIEVAQ